MSNSNYSRLTTPKARSHCVLWPAQLGRKLVLGTRRKWPRPRRWQLFSRRDREETETRRWYVSRPSRDRDVETETTALYCRCARVSASSALLGCAARCLSKTFCGWTFSPTISLIISQTHGRSAPRQKYINGSVVPGSGTKKWFRRYAHLSPDF